MPDSYLTIRTEPRKDGGRSCLLHSASHLCVSQWTADPGHSIRRSSIHHCDASAVKWQSGGAHSSAACHLFRGGQIGTRRVRAQREYLGWWWWSVHPVHDPDTRMLECRGRAKDNHCELQEDGDQEDAVDAWRIYTIALHRLQGLACRPEAAASPPRAGDAAATGAKSAAGGESLGSPAGIFQSRSRLSMDETGPSGSNLVQQSRSAAFDRHWPRFFSAKDRHLASCIVSRRHASLTV
nr:hypothetical protein CFP56_07950 [Quercus suber]